jgi:predicted SnoaL-like aldol condensation-catalyzing enzyme
MSAASPSSASWHFQDGRIAEHEDVLQEVPTATDSEDVFATLSHPQTSSPGQRWLTSYNKQLVTAYVDQLPFRKDLTAVDAYVGSEYHSHCTAAPDTRGRAVVDLFRVRNQKTSSTGSPDRTFRRPPPTTTRCSDATDPPSRVSAAPDTG